MDQIEKILKTRIEVLKSTISLKDGIINALKSINKIQSETIIDQEYTIMILERKLNKLQSNHANENEN